MREFIETKIFTVEKNVQQKKVIRIEMMMTQSMAQVTKNAKVAARLLLVTSDISYVPEILMMFNNFPRNMLHF